MCLYLHISLIVICKSEDVDIPVNGKVHQIASNLMYFTCNKGYKMEEKSKVTTVVCSKGKWKLLGTFPKCSGKIFFF